LAKKCKFEKVKRQKALIEKYRERRAELMAKVKNPDATLEERIAVYAQLAKIPRDASPTRLRNRCQLTGRSRGYLRRFGVSRIALRELALEGKLPGVTKSSW